MLIDVEKLLDRLGVNFLLLGKIVLIVIAAVILERSMHALMRRAYLHSDRSPEDLTRYRFLRNALRLVVGLVAFGAIIYSIPSIKHLALTLFAGAGILVAILGLAAQKAFANIISGIFIVSFKPFRVGDLIQVGDGPVGRVEDVTLRHTVILTFENRRIIIPNASISDANITNSTIRDEATCEFIEVGISYESDLDRAMHLMQEEAMAHPDQLDRRTAEELEHGDPAVSVRLISIADSSLLLRAYVWSSDPVTARVMHYDLNRAIKLRFDKEGIDIPYPHRTLTFKGPGPKPFMVDEEGR